MWTHYCEAEKSLLDVDDDHECNWCGATAPAAEQAQAENKSEESDA